jgi:hypothetical protein
VTVIGAVGGGAGLALFPAKGELFGAYGIGLFSGFFGYFLILLTFVAISKKFGAEFFLEGRARSWAMTSSSRRECPRKGPWPRGSSSSSILFASANTGETPPETWALPQATFPNACSG